MARVTRIIQLPCPLPLILPLILCHRGKDAWQPGTWPIHSAAIFDTGKSVAKTKIKFVSCRTKYSTIRQVCCRVSQSLRFRLPFGSPWGRGCLINCEIEKWRKYLVKAYFISKSFNRLFDFNFWIVAPLISPVGLINASDRRVYIIKLKNCDLKSAQGVCFLFVFGGVCMFFKGDFHMF